MKIGVISDTHSYFHPRIPEAFKGVEKIIHAGDLGGREVYERLSLIAPVIWVKGNHEPEGMPEALADFGRIELAGKKIRVTHSLTTMRWEDFRDALVRLDRLPFPEIDLVIFGHTHFPIWERIRGICFLNPGYCGADPFESDRTCALLNLSGPDLSAEIFRL